MRALVVGSTTIDVLDKTFRIGGSTYYGGVTLSRYLGDETHVLTTIDDNVSRYFRSTFSELGISLHSVKCSRVPHFVIKQGKAVNVVVNDCRIPPDVVRDLIRIIKPDIIFLAPVYREIDVRDYINLLRSLKDVTAFKALDIQGLVRVSTNEGIKCSWREDLLDLMSLVNLTHGNIKEFCFSNNVEYIIKSLTDAMKPYDGAVTITMDSSYVYLLHGGKCFKATPLKVVITDEVGAGDVFTVSAAHYAAEGKDLLYAVRAGIVAASLKVWRAHGTWFTKEDLEKYLHQIVFSQTCP